MYFPGWRARLTTGGEQVIDAVAVNGVFRSWLLPAGGSTMRRASSSAPSHIAARVRVVDPHLASGLVRVVETRPHLLMFRHARVAACGNPRTTCVVAVSAVLLACNLSAADRTMYGDAAGYWSLARTSTFGNDFSLDGYADQLRGHSLPFMLYACSDWLGVASMRS